MRKLLALRPILYLAHQYKIGEELPQENEELVSDWLEAGSAAWIDDETDWEEFVKLYFPQGAAKARSVTAQPGATGQSSDGNQDPLAGRLPKQR